MAFDYKPKLTEKEFDEYMASYHRLIEDRRIGRLSHGDYVRKRSQLNTDFHSGIDSSDMRFFHQIDGLRELLMQIMPLEVVEKNVSHELEHGRKAESLGYSVQYGVWLMQGFSGNLVVVPFTRMNEESNSSHLDQIKNAATNLSTYDRL